MKRKEKSKKFSDLFEAIIKTKWIW